MGKFMPTEKKKTAKKTTAKKHTTKKTTAKKIMAKKTPTKKTTAKGSTKEKPAVMKTKTIDKPKNELPKIDIYNINLLPLMIRTGVSGFPLETTYFDTDMCRKGFYYLVHNNGKYFLLLPKWNERVINEMETGKTVIITRGSHEGIKDSFEIVFDDGSENPYSVLLRDEQFTRITPLKEGWNGTLYVYSGDIDECRLIFNYVYYRITDNLPCFDPIIDEIDKSQSLTPLSNDKEITDHVRAILKPLLESNNFPLLGKRLSLDNITNQLVKRFVIGGKVIKDVDKINFEIILTQLENSLK
jgi:hypothetical protein